MIEAELLSKLIREQFRIAGFPDQAEPIDWAKRHARGPGQTEFEEILEMCATVRVLKLDEYGWDHLEPKHPVRAVVACMHDLQRKWTRLDSLVWADDDLSSGLAINLFGPDTDPGLYGRTVETLLDMVNYATQFIQLLWRLYAFQVVATASDAAVSFEPDSKEEEDTDEGPRADRRSRVTATSTDQATYGNIVTCVLCERNFSFNCVRGNVDARRGVGPTMECTCPHCHEAFEILLKADWPVAR